MARERSHRPARTARSRAPRSVVVVAVPDAQVLDVTGPIEVFSGANRWLAERGRDAFYRIELVARDRAPIATSCGLRLIPDRALGAIRGPVDTLLVAGGRGILRVLDDRVLLAALKRLASDARRLGSVCTGSFLIAEAGLLDGRRATTHWQACEAFARRYPRVRVDPDPIFTRDGNVYTSAGVTAGMDLALALVEEDLGRDVALAVARNLVLFLRRPGGQSQFSAQLAVQSADREPLRELLAWIADHPGSDLSVPALADRGRMSARNFARVFRAETGSTPGRFVEKTRVEAARRRLEETEGGVDAIAAECGFGTSETMRRSFLRVLRVPPSAYRSRFRAA